MKNSMDSFTKEELLEILKGWSEYCNCRNPQELMYDPTGEQAYTQLKAIIMEYFSDPNKKSLSKLAEEYDVPYSLVHAIDARLSQDYEQSGGVDEDITKWIDEHIRYNELTVVEDHICADEAQKEIDMLKRINQLLTRQPVQVDEVKE